MTSITASMVKELREKSGAGMMDCKTALSENNGDINASIDWLRSKGFAKAAKKAGRVASDGLVGVAVKDNLGVVIEINSETDFVARNEQFQKMVSQISELALNVDGDFDQLQSAIIPSVSKPVSEYIKEMVATIGENMTLRRSNSIKASGIVTSYVHNQVSSGMGKIGVIIGLDSDGDKVKLSELGRKIAMHIAAANPLALTKDDLDPSIVEKEKSVLTDQARESGRPENVIEKMIEGRLRKFYEEVVLLSQTFVMDGENTIQKILDAASSDLGSDVKISGFIRYELGEGIEKEETDFASEVAAAVSQ